MESKTQLNNKIVYFVFIVIGFLIIMAGGLSVVMGVLFERTNFIYLGLALLAIGFVLAITVMITLIVKLLKKR